SCTRAVYDCLYTYFLYCCIFYFFFSSRRRHTRCYRDWSSDVCSSDLMELALTAPEGLLRAQDKKLVRAGLRAPDLALATRELAHARITVGERIGLECLGLGIEAEDGVRAPVRSEERRVGRERGGGRER